MAKVCSRSDENLAVTRTVKAGGLPGTAKLANFWNCG